MTSMKTLAKMAATMSNVDEIRNRVILGEFDIKNVSDLRLYNKITYIKILFVSEIYVQMLLELTGSQHLLAKHNVQLTR